MRHTIRVTKAQLAEQLTTTLGVPNKQEAERTVDAVFAALVKVLQSGDKIDIRGFGTFKVKDQPARQARNPRTGEAIAVPAKKVAVFKAGKELAAALNTSDEQAASTSA